MAHVILFVKFRRFNTLVKYLVRKSSTASSMADLCGDSMAKVSFSLCNKCKPNANLKLTYYLNGVKATQII